MLNTKLKKFGAIAGLSLSLIVAGCGQDDAENDTTEADNSNDNQTEETANVGEEIDYTITGIEPGAGITQATENAIEEYDSFKGWNQETASTAAMLTALGEAIDNEEPVIVAGWSPHYMFAKYDLKYLEDPKEVYGGVEIIKTITRKGLKEDMPEAYEVLDRFHWEPADMEQVMLDAQEMDFEEAAQKWVNNNEDKVAEWTEGVDSVDGTSIELVQTPWDTERSSGYVAKNVLETLGYDAEVTTVSPSVAFKAIAQGDGDASLAPWMPATHGDFYDKYEGEFDDLGENLKGAKIGLVVPEYMDIDSIEDLKAKE
ncbi:glycine betaine ABC transporter substrate-binding protein [Halobacillus salinus]|uniref:Glycine/betaine ABC transporter n=1 Tax=Halobacillus salinus TaxID=192814 RepID=A0A4Z0GW18_9BACI|nr:glycine betaine ABC transporter substrate-binding protein [Halobacillus salinus]TGB01448.1 glycine/betaine ABC transporter [Halobacillus salinus]